MNNWKKTCLDGQWKLGLIDNSELVKRNIAITSANQLKQSGITVIPGSVPGNFELDMQTAGMIEDPFFGMNTLAMQDLEAKHLFYSLKFDYDGKSDPTSDLYLTFEGIDTFADIYLNGTLIASTDNMLIPHEIKLDSLDTGICDLLVHIKPTAIIARDLELGSNVFTMPYNYAGLKIRKAAHSFAWDIMPRIVSGGIWRSVYLTEKPAERIDEAFLYTNGIIPIENAAWLELFYNVKIVADSLKPYSIRVKGVCGDSSFSAQIKLWHTCGKLQIRAEDAKLWWPKDLGEPNLYDTVVELCKDDEVVDSFRIQHGIRTTKLDRTSITDPNGDGEFCFHINGEKLFVKGTNWVPADAFHSRDKSRLPKMLEMLDDIGCNAVRCWGGNVYEDDIFYEFCDQHGIIVWQDFAMGCAAYSQDKDFCDAIFREVTVIVKVLRNHPSIVIWAGDNECDQSACFWNPSAPYDPNTHIVTRKTIPEALTLCDHTRPYLPSSPYIDEEAYKAGYKFLPEDHLWGPRDYFKGSYYAQTSAHFASEMGYHGCNAPEAIAKFISPDKLWPWNDNHEWLVHCASPEDGMGGQHTYRIPLMANQIRELFGYIPDNLHDFALASQISQAEAFKFFIELFRTSKWRRTGIIWWNLIDGWPQFSDAVVDYFYTKKLAYNFIKRSQQTVCIMLTEPTDWHNSVMAANDSLQTKEISYKIRDLAADSAVVLEGNTILAPNSCRNLGRLFYSMGEKHFYLIEWECDGVKGRNHYMAGTPPFDLKTCIGWLEQAEMLELEGF